MKENESVIFYFDDGSLYDIPHFSSLSKIDGVEAEKWWLNHLSEKRWFSEKAKKDFIETIK